MSTRHPDKVMLDSWGAFETAIKLSTQALSGGKIARYKNLSQLVHENFFKFDKDWRNYKVDTIQKVCKTEEAFNEQKVDEESGNNVPEFYHNDSWARVQMSTYSDIMDQLQEGFAAQQQESEEENSHANVDLLVMVVKSEFSALETDIKRLTGDIQQLVDCSILLFTKSIYDVQIHNFCSRLTEGLMEKANDILAASEEATDPEFSKLNLKVKLENFIQDQQGKLGICSSLLIKKVKPESSDVETKPFSSSTSKVSQQPREQVYLEKTKPPKFNGEDIEFPEFKRKWTSLVTKANLPVETELDKLKDALPKDAKEQLFGVSTLAEGWKILTKRYGDPLIISQKLKSQLKNIQPTGKNDPERVINLKVKVRNVVTRLEALQMGDALKYDQEFLSAVYNALPDRHKKGWWDYSKTDDLWASMLTYLDKIYEQSNGELAMLPIFSKQEPDKSSPKGVKSAGVSAGAVGGVDDDEDIIKLREAKKVARESCGICPVCSKLHTYKRRDSTSWPSDRFLKCKKFCDMNIQQRATTVQKANGCPRCTSWGHQRKDCTMRSNSCGEDVSGTRCTGDHSRLLHGSGNVYCGAAKSKFLNKRERHSSTATVPLPSTMTGLDISDPFSFVNESEEAIYFLQDIPLKQSSSTCRTLWDKGSNRVLVREEFAKENKLVSREVTYMMEVVGGEEHKIVHSNIYLLDLVDMYGNVRTLWGYGVPRVMSSSVPDLSPIRKLFPHIPEDAFKALETKDVDVLIGLNMMELQPSGGMGVDRVGGMSALRSIFGCGWVLGGHHPDIQSAAGQEISSFAVTLKVAKLLIRPEPSHSPEFWEAEGMGVLPPPRCDSCKSCMKSGSCSERHYEHGLKKQAELDLIKSKTKLINGEVWCEYPFIKNPSCLPYNRHSAVRVAEKVEKDLMKDGLHDVYCEQIKQFLDRGVAVMLSAEEMKSWTGPCQYITHHGVLKDSVSTPLRVVTNSSFNNGGNSLNSCLASGPNSLNPMLDVMLRFRSYPIAIHLDLSKAYNTLRTGLVERHVRRFVWRFSPQEDWQDFALDRVHFGDLCAATQLEVGKDLVADAGVDIDPEASKKIKDDLYVDDGLTGGDEELVARFVGEKLPDGSFNGTLSKILALGNYKIKAMTVSGSKKSEDSDLMGNKVLGYTYDVEDDMLGLHFGMNISKKKRSVRLEPNLTLQDVDKLRSSTLSKRVLLGVTNGFGDFLGIGTPHTIKFKALMRELFLLEEPLTWDDPVPEEMRTEWVDLMVETLRAGDLPFHRSTRPADAAPGVGPSVVGFGDYGQLSYEARVYLRWQLSESSAYSARLAICKAKVPPLRGLTVPRGELTALTLLSRLVMAVIMALQKLDTPPVSSIMLIDSKCSMCAVQTTKPLLPYFQNRVAEVRDNMDQIRKLCPMEEIHYVESALNPSDMSTRATTKITELGPDSLHQAGPEFLCLPRSEWPVSRDYSASDLPTDEVRLRDKVVFSAAFRANFCHDGVFPKNPWVVIEELLFYSNNINKVIRIIARYLRGMNAGFRKCKVMTKDNLDAYNLIAPDPKKQELDTAERLLLLHGMVHTQDALAAGKLSSLLPTRDGKLIVTRGRLGEQSLVRLLGVSSLPILMATSRVAYLYMVHAHCGEFGLVHRSVVSTLARSRKKVWIVRGRDLARKVVNSCPRCDLDRKETLLQQMADIKDEQLTVAPPWSYIALDFAGPYIVKGEVNKRARMKIWILLYCCRATRAVCLLACPGYSTSDFLCKHAEFVFRKGQPISMVSDKGSQLVAAGKVVANKLDWDKVAGDNPKTEWTFVPAGAQHRNGISEATVKVMKKSLDLALQPGTVLTYAEMVTLLAKISYSINTRPLTLQAISPNSQQEDNMMPITPNHLLLARSSIEVPDMQYDEENKFSTRLNYVQEVFNAWWEKWIQDVLPTLVPCKRWKDIRKNLKKGDIVLMKYEGNMQDDYRRARVLEVYPDHKNLVRTVKVGFRKRDKREKSEDYWKKPLSEQIVAIQRLAVLQASGEPLPTGGPDDQLPADAGVRAALIRVAVDD